MFCTLREAAAWLRTTEPQLKAMLAKGILPEFRDGADRLVRVSDIRSLAVMRRPDHPKRHEQPLQTHTENVSPRGGGYESHEVYASQIKLPPSGTAALTRPASNTRTLRRPSVNRQPRTSAGGFTDARQASRSARRFQSPPVPSDAYAWPRRQVAKPSARKGLWRGVMEDRPSAIVAVSALAIVVLSALVAGAYLLVELL